MDWSAARYMSFDEERTRPARDLLAQVPVAGVETAMDLGCGPGNSTALLAARYPAARILGLDSSPDMIAAARQRLPGVDFQTGDIATWGDPGPFDVILANAALQWLPDHATLFPALVAKLASGGHLAVQMPDNLDEPAHRAMREIAADGPWAVRLAPVIGARARHDAAWYWRLLRDEAARVDVWRTVYHHALAGGTGAVVDWFRSAGLRPFLAPLDAAEQGAFLERYRAAMAEGYPALPDGTVLLPFPRLFIVVTR